MSLFEDGSDSRRVYFYWNSMKENGEALDISMFDLY
jgi:hypothetical protein